MNHLIVLPVVLPALAGAALVLLRLPLVAQRMLSLAATLALGVIAGALLVSAAGGDSQSYALGNWPAPFGIVLVLDRLAAIMLLLTACVALWSLLHALQGADSAGRHFHALFQFQLMGLNGAFLTGDLFNLFVFFEVLLIASYCLLLHGGKSAQLTPGLHYVTINFAGSFLFLIAVSLLYGVTGTLNMADMAARVSAAPPRDAGLIRAGALLMLVVFAVKAALLPLYFWLPRAYSEAAPPVAALFALMTKVGVYVIVRVYTLVFGPGAGVAADVALPWLLPAAVATLLVASFGVLASRNLRVVVSYLTIASVGTICIGFSLGSDAALGAALYYLVHSTLTIALLFLLADLIARSRGEVADLLARGRPLAHPTMLGALFLGGAVAAAGIPPLGGFHGKVMLLQASAGHAAAAWVWAALLLNALLCLIALARAGSKMFWHTADATPPPPCRRVEYVPALGLMAAIVALTVWANPIASYTAEAAAQLRQTAGQLAGMRETARRGPPDVPAGVKP